MFESARMGASCGLEGMVLDRRYLVFTSTEGDVQAASLCGGTAPATPERLKAVERLLGEATQPAEVEVADAAPPTRTRSPVASGTSGWAVGGGLVGAAVLLGAGLLVRRRSA